MTFGPGLGKVYAASVDNAAKVQVESNLVPSKPTLTQLQAVKALLLGGGIGLPGAWQSVAGFLNAANSITGQLNRIVRFGIGVTALYKYAQNNLPGVALMVGGGILAQQLKNAGLDENNIIVSGLQRAGQMFKDPISFLKMASRAQENAEATYGQAATVGVLGLANNIGQLLLNAQTLTDLLTGGVTSSIGPGAPNTISGQRIAASGIPLSANDIRQGLAAVSQAIRGFGTLFNVSDAANIGTPIGLINSLREQGIAEAINLDQYLTDNYIDPTADLENYSPVDLKVALSAIEGAQLKYVIQETGVVIWSEFAQVRSVADLLNPNVVLPKAALDHIPGASLTGFGQVIDSWGVSGTATWLEIADILDQLEIPDCPDINNVNIPSFYASLGPYIPSGSGLFGQATIKDFIGTVGGHVHQDAANQLYSASQVIQNSPEGQDLKAAMDYFETHSDPNDPLYNYAVSQMQLAMQNLARSSNPRVQAAIQQSNSSALDSALQIVNEIQNAVLVAGGIINAVEAFYDAYTVIAAKVAAFSAASNPKPDVPTKIADSVTNVTTQPGDLLKGIQGAWQALNKLIDFVMNDLGLGGLIDGMITNDPAGQSLRAVIAEARNKQKLARIGMDPSRGSLDYESYAKVLRATKGEGLTAEQIRIISTDAILKGYRVEDMLALNSLFGYDHSYYDKLQYS